jgi:hypothetical protein
VIGLSKSKIDAVNRDINEYKKHWDIVLLASDDMIPQIKGYDNIIRDNMMFNYPILTVCYGLMMVIRVKN